MSGPGRQPVSSSISLAAASSSDTPASTTPAASSQAYVSVMKPGGAQPHQVAVEVAAVGQFHVGEVDP